MELEQTHLDRIAELETRLLQAEQERDHFRALFDHMPAYMAALSGPDYVYTYSNPLNNQLLSHRQVLGKPLGEALPGPVAEVLLPLLDQVYLTGEPYVADELSVMLDLRGDGQFEEIYLNGVYQPVRDASGEVTAIISHAVDVTEQVLARREREAHEEQRRRSRLAREYETLAENSPDVVARWDSELRHLYVNSAVTRVTGLPAEAFIGKTHAEMGMPAEAVDFFQRHIRAVFESGVSAVVDFIDPLDPANPQYFQAQLVPERGPDGNVESVLGITRDITPLKQAEAEMMAQKALTDRIIANVSAGINFIDRDLVYRWINPAFLRILGLPLEQMLDHYVFDVFPGTEDQIGPLLRGVLESGEPYHGSAFPFTYTLDGRTVTHYWDFVYQPVFDEHGQVEGLLTVATEVTDRMEKERLQAEWIERLRRADRMKDAFLSVVSHELRTPLNFIMGFASILEDELHGPLNEQQHYDVEKILGGSERMLRLVNDLLDVAKIQAGRLELFRETVDPRAALEDVVSTLAPLAAQKPVSLSLSVAATGRPKVDKARLTQVLTNLVSNAIKFTPAGGSVSVRALERSDAFVFEVSDTGIGIAQDHLPRLFQPFEQLDMSATREHGGTGLGLAITKALVDAHGGTLEVESVLRQGSLFRVTLPRV
jgi:PAS domain S-box-containing protein